jgi:hypothetical protein
MVRVKDCVSCYRKGNLTVIPYDKYWEPLSDELQDQGSDVAVEAIEKLVTIVAGDGFKGRRLISELIKKLSQHVLDTENCSGELNARCQKTC